MKKNKEIIDNVKVIEEANRTVISLPNNVKLSSGPEFRIFFNKMQKIKDAKKITIDCSKISDYDSFLVIVINKIEVFCSERSIEYSLEGTDDDMQRFLTLLSPTDLDDFPDDDKTGFFYKYFSNIGNITMTIFTDAMNFIEFFGDLVIKFLTLFVRPRQMRWKDFPYHLTRAGVEAVPIVVLILFLIGVITGYQSAAQLKQFGADIYVADLIGISISRELAPLMTAIIVAGRSGSAFAAEIGTMKVSEEIDALKSIGFDHIQFLVLPRVTAVMLAMPILVILADVAGIAGGLVAALASLNITLTGYVNELQSALSYVHIFTGLGKSVLFGLLVASIGCFRGLQVTGGAESVGKFTTTSVVTGIMLIILSDAILTFVFSSLGI